MSIKTTYRRRPASYLCWFLDEEKDATGRVWQRSGYIDSTIGVARVYSYEHKDGRQDVNVEIILEGERHILFQNRTQRNRLTKRGIAIVAGRWLRALEAELYGK